MVIQKERLVWIALRAKKGLSLNNIVERASKETGEIS